MRYAAVEALGQQGERVPEAVLNRALHRLLALRLDKTIECISIAADDALAEILSLEAGIEDD